MPKVILKAKNLVKKYGKNETTVTALDQINLDVYEGEFLAITGASGSGKSTLLHMLGAMDKPTSGEVLFDDRPIFSGSDKELSIYRRRNVGVIFQFYNLLPILTVEENICLPMTLDGQKVEKEWIEQLLKVVGLQQRRNHYPAQLSGGQQQRAAIARSLVHRPRVILADEPTGNLDLANSREIIDLLKSMSYKYNQTLIIVTHDPNIAAQSDRNIVISDGRIKEG